MNICGCGASAGYPHKPECPRPLYRGSDADWIAWQVELEHKLAELEEPRYVVVGPSRRHDGTPYVQFAGPRAEAGLVASRHPARRVELEER